MAYELVKQRIKKEVTLPLLDKDPNYRTTPPKRGQDEKKEKGFVYIISNPSWKGRYKVGIAKNPQNRLNSFQTSDPDRAYKLEFALETPYFKKIESHIHKKFKAANEWVKIEIKKLKQTIIDYDHELQGKAH